MYKFLRIWKRCGPSITEYLYKTSEIIAKDSFDLPGAGYNIKNKTIIEWFKITEEEQTRLKTIIGDKESRRRDRVYRSEKRRSEVCQWNVFKIYDDSKE